MNILCFGDSNTFGISPFNGKRLAEAERWPGVLAGLLGAKHQIIEAGMPNRTLVANPPFDGEKSGVKYLKPYLEAHSLDVIIIQLGTNDLKARFALSEVEIANALEAFILKIDNFYYGQSKPKIIVISPPIIYEVGVYQSIYSGAHIKSQALSEHLAIVCNKQQCGFFKTPDNVIPCETEGVHLTVKSHQNLAASIFKSLIGGAFSVN